MLSWEGRPMIALSSIRSQAVTLHMGHKPDHIHLELNKVL